MSWAGKIKELHAEFSKDPMQPYNSRWEGPWNQSKKCTCFLQLQNDIASTCLCQGFYDEVSSPLLLEVDLRYPDNVVDSLTTNHFNQLFNGSEIVVAGRMMDNDLNNFLVEVHGQGVRRVQQMKWLSCFVVVFFNGSFFPPQTKDDFDVQGLGTALDWGVIYPEDEYIFGDFAERLWAYLTIQQLLDKRCGFDRVVGLKLDRASWQVKSKVSRHIMLDIWIFNLQ